MMRYYLLLIAFFSVGLFALEKEEMVTTDSVVTGAGVGIGVAELTWRLSDKMFGKAGHVSVGSSVNTVDVASEMVSA